MKKQRTDGETTAHTKRVKRATRVVEDTTITGEAWRDEYCRTCKAARQMRRDEHGTWRCMVCGTEPDAHTQRRLTGAESNARKQPSQPAELK
jgi:ribosomal protein L37AE/L43A